MKKFISTILLSFILIFGGIMGNALAFASSPQMQKITYVAFGDSIAEGYAINLKTKTETETLFTGDDSYSFIDNSYTELIKSELEKTYSVSAYNFSHSGDTCQDLIDYLNQFYDYENNTAKDSNTQNTLFTTLTNGQIYEKVSSADVITVCIGANNVLKQASTLIPQFLGLQSPAITQAEMETTCKDYIIGNSDAGIKGFKAEFAELLQIFNKLNPNAKIYFTNIYNPYKVLDANSTISSLSAFYPKLTQANLNIISSTTELVIAGGKDVNGKNYTGINNIIANTISQFNSNKYIFVNSKSLFDNQFDGTNASTRKNYNNYVNTRLDELTSLNINNYIDPHPTKQGHELIFNAHKTANIIPNQKITISFVTGCEDVLSNQVIDRGSKIPKPRTLRRDNYTLVGWYSDSSLKTEWNFENTPTDDMTLYAKWERIEPKSHLTTILIIGGVLSLTLITSGIIVLIKRKKSIF